MARHTDRVWTEFADWCRARRLAALPAHPWTVAAFARWCEPRFKAADIARRVRVIARVHVLAGRRSPDRHPTVTRTLRAIEAHQQARRAGASLFRAADFAGTPDPARPARSAAGPARGKKTRRLESRPKLVARRPKGPGKG